ncbi:MAG: glycoside hydrolase family 3 protein [Ruminococcaceae bacterium]|nr:glycoside hydrolase family 3 protein [Oscillospiraceae bacterium]
MEHAPENTTKKSAKRRAPFGWGKKLVTLIFTAFVLVIAYLVYQAMTKGVGIPVSSTGIIEMDQNAITAPTTAQPTESAEPTESTEPSTSIEPSETETEPPQLSPEQLARQYLDEMSLEDQIWQMFCISPSQMRYEDGTLCPAGGVYFGAEDLTDADRLSQDILSFNEEAATPVMIGVMEEGGSVAPLASLGVTDSFDSAATYGEIGNTQALYEFGNLLGSQLSDVGFHFNLAPVADTINWYPDDLNDRTYSIDVDTASQMVSQAVKGMQDAGTIACLKHFPNLGSSAPDGDNDVSWRPYTSFVETDFLPFSAGIEAGAQMVLVSNMMVPDMCGGALMPSCMSENIVTNILRGELGFNGVVISDEQSRQTDAQSAVNIIEAGCDIILLPNDPAASVAAVIEAVNNGTLSEERITESVYRILLMKCENGIIIE